MQLRAAITLIEKGNIDRIAKTRWADLGCGNGLFTRALASFLPPSSTLYAVDTNSSSVASLRRHKVAMIDTLRLDFVQDTWSFDGLDGILIANSLHYVSDKTHFLRKASQHLNEFGYFLIVEYDTETPNPWVPYPIGFDLLKRTFNEIGYTSVEKLQERASLYQRGNLYAARVSR